MINFKMRTFKTGADEAMTHGSGIHFLVSLMLSCSNELHVGENENHVRKYYSPLDMSFVS